MSSDEPQNLTREFPGVDAVVLAGTRGAKPFVLDRGPVQKPYLELGGETLVGMVTRALLAARRVGRIFVVGDSKRLADVLIDLRLAQPDRVVLVQEGENLLDNCRLGFFQHVLPGRAPQGRVDAGADGISYRLALDSDPEATRVPVLYTTADMPFVDAADFDWFLERIPDDITMAMGLMDHRSLSRMQDDFADPGFLDNWKLGALHMRQLPVRLNNLFFARPLSAHPAIYGLLGVIYEHRWLLNQNGSVNWKNWWTATRALVRFSIKVNGLARFVRGAANAIPMALAEGLARVTHRWGRAFSWPFRQFLSKRDMEFVFSILVGAPCVSIIDQHPGCAIDVDVEESFLYLKQDQESQFLRIRDYLASLRKI